jgi:hypothetical protein
VDQGTPPTPKKCVLCNAPPLKQPDPDGGRRCVGHSLDPVQVAKRQARAEAGRASGAQQRGVARDKRKAVLVGAIPIERARAEHAAQQKIKAAEPVSLKTKEDVLAFLGKHAGKLGECEDSPATASAAAAIARAALAAMGLDEQEAAENAKPRSFNFVTTEGKALNLAGRDSGAN